MFGWRKMGVVLLFLLIEVGRRVEEKTKQTTTKKLDAEISGQHPSVAGQVTFVRLFLPLCNGPHHICSKCLEAK